MSLDRFNHRLSHVVLCTSLLAAGVLFAVPGQYTPGVSHSLDVVLMTTMVLSAWRLGASAVRGEAEEPRKLAVAGALLVMPWVLFPLLAGFSAPMFATPAQNKLRFLLLFINVLTVSGGLIVLREALSEAGERFHSTIGFAATVLVVPLYLTWATIAVYIFTVKVRDVSVPLPAWIITLADMSEIPLFFGGVLTYVASAAFALSLGRARWLGRRATRAFVITSLGAVLCLVVRGIEYPNFKDFFEHWYAIPGFVVGIPAAPWMMPCLIGVILLRRAGAPTGALLSRGS